MSNYGWTNSDGEPIMDGAAYRFEQQLDMDSMADYMEDHFYDDYDEPEACEDYDHECDDCNGPGGIWTKDGDFTPHPGQVWHCAHCDRPCPAGAHDEPEDEDVYDYIRDEQAAMLDAMEASMGIEPRGWEDSY